MPTQYENLQKRLGIAAAELAVRREREKLKAERAKNLSKEIRSRRYQQSLQELRTVMAAKGWIYRCGMWVADRKKSVRK